LQRPTVYSCCFVAGSLGAGGDEAARHAAVILYTVSWARFDNTTGSAAPIGTPVTVTETRATAPAELPSTPGAFVKVQISGTGGAPEWSTTVDAYFRHTSAGWTLVGFERLP